MYFTITIITIFFINVYMVLFLFNNAFLLNDYVFSLYVYVWLPWLRFSVLFPQLQGKCQGKPRKDGARPALFLVVVLLYVFFVLLYVFLCCSMYCLFCDVLCIICVYMCTEQLPQGGYPIAVKYIIYIIWSWVVSFTTQPLELRRMRPW
jgi:hypothetical protein